MFSQILKFSYESHGTEEEQLSAVLANQKGDVKNVLPFCFPDEELQEKKDESVRHQNSCFPSFWESRRNKNS